MAQPTRGGRRPNAGRKSGPQGPRVKTAITMRPDQYEATKAARSGMIEAALDKWLNMTYFIQVPAPHNLLIRVEAKDDAHFIERLSNEDLTGVGAISLNVYSKDNPEAMYPDISTKKTPTVGTITILET